MKEPRPDPLEAQRIVHVAASRALGGRLRLRYWAVILWAAFLGAACAVIALLVVPAGWLDEPLTFGRLTALFLGAWAVALVPAVTAAVLLAPPPRAAARAR